MTALPFYHRSIPAGFLWLSIILCSFVLLSCNETEEDLVHASQIGRWQYISTKHGLGSSYVNVVFEDSKGIMWIGTTGGVTKAEDNNIYTFTIADGLLDNSVFTISEDRDGNIWVGTRRGVNILRDGRWYYVPYLYGAPVFSLVNLKDDEGMLIGTGGYGIFRYNYETEHIVPFNSIGECDECNSINSMFQSRDGSVWIATFAGARRMRGNFVTRFDQKDGLAGDIATTITEDSWGNIWIGTVEGKTISKIQGNTVTQVSFNNGAEQNFIFGIQEDDEGGLWVGTVSNGLFYYDGAIMKVIKDGPPDKTITALYKDSRGNLWVGTAEAGLGIYIMNPRR